LVQIAKENKEAIGRANEGHNYLEKIGKEYSEKRTLNRHEHERVGQFKKGHKRVLGATAEGGW